MVLYLCMIPNRGARIGHQTYDHFSLVTYCKKNNFIFVYHPFTGNSENFEDILKFGIKYDKNYNNTKIIVDKIIQIKNLEISEIENIHEKLIEINNSKEKVMLFDSISENENFFKKCNFNNNDIIETKKSYRNILLKYYPNLVNNHYICIHIRQGDIINMQSRFLNTDYFINKYFDLIKTIDEQNLPVYIVTENNFKDDFILNEKIKNCNIIKSDEITSFYYLVHCKYLIASRSGFSNLAYILGNMKVIVPSNDWNDYWDNKIN